LLALLTANRDQKRFTISQVNGQVEPRCS